MSKFSSLPKYKALDLHLEINKINELLTPSELQQKYINLKHEYESLKVFLENERAYEETLKKLSNSIFELSKAYKSALAECQINFTKSNGFFKTLFTNDNEIPLSANCLKIKSEIQKLEAEKKSLVENKKDYSSQIKRRKIVYHELKAISTLRSIEKAENQRALAKSAIDKSRSTAQKNKREQQKKLNYEHCPYCDKLTSPGDFVLDHIYPISKGGLDTTRNTVLVCNSCNSRKSNKTLKQFCDLNGLHYISILGRLENLQKDV